MHSFDAFKNLLLYVFVYSNYCLLTWCFCFSDRFKGEKVATLEEGIEECLKLNLKLILDVKEYDNRVSDF